MHLKIKRPIKYNLDNKFGIPQQDILLFKLDVDINNRILEETILKFHYEAERTKIVNNEEVIENVFLWEDIKIISKAENIEFASQIESIINSMNLNNWDRGLVQIMLTSKYFILNSNKDLNPDLTIDDIELIM